MEGVSKAFVQRLGNSPSHQQVGKNGSFWLPPEAKSEGFSTKLRDADSKLGGKNDTKAALKNKVQTPAQAKIKHSVRERAETVLPQKSAPNSSFGKTTPVQSRSKAFPFKSITGRGIGRQTLAIPNAIEPLLTQNQGLPTNQTFKGNLRDSGIQSMLLKNEVNPDAEAEVRDKRRNSSHGIKSAFNEDMEVSFKTQLSLEVVGRELTAVSKKSSSQTRSFFEFAGKELLPRIAYFAKHDKKVVRFAMDLPNGSKLGVRIEKSKSGLRLCLISSDEKSQKNLEELKGLLNEFSESENGHGELKVFHFQNYKQMDDYFQQAA
tara:strand:- start:869 stop:1828 length:960 start_codon:yes stop_codon:yes gene_type:complete